MSPFTEEDAIKGQGTFEESVFEIDRSELRYGRLDQTDVIFWNGDTFTRCD